MKSTRLAAVLGALLLAASGPGCWGAEAASSEKERQALADEVEQLRAQARPFTDLFVKTIELALPSVVSITTTRTVRVQTPQEWPMPFPFEINPNEPNAPRRPRQRERPESVTGLGSGFVVDAVKGFVVTNAHVVRDVKPENIKLTFQDGHEVTALKVLVDSRTDVAVIQIPPDHLVALQWAGPEEVKRGQWVIAAGSPMGFGGSVTAGIISAPSTRNRFFGNGQPGAFTANPGDPYAVEDYIQTDAAINPGNSGGPLLSLDGKVIGINTLIVSSTFSSAGLGFAVPQRLAQPVVETLINNGRVVRGHMGIAIIEPSKIDDDAAWDHFRMRNADEVLNKFHLSKDDKGCVIEQVMPGGPADKAGLEEGDLIRAIGGTRTPNVDKLREVVAGTAPGTQVEVSIVRAGREQKIKVTVGEQPSGEKSMAEEGAESSTSEALGLTIQELTPELADALGYAEDLKGVIVADVAADGPAAKARPPVQRNDVILEVNGAPVRSIEDFDAAIGKARSDKKENIALSVQRGEKKQLMIALKLPK
ncbi:MAG: trypsin-like peptidase domain-containing protein [Candidatus Brocadiia bacterium]